VAAAAAATRTAGTGALGQRLDTACAGITRLRPGNRSAASSPVRSACSGHITSKTCPPDGDDPQ